MDGLKDFVKANIWLALGFVILALVLYQFVDPAPPRELTIATGSKEGRYYKLGMALQQALAEEGITLHVVSTAGSGDNMALLSDASSEVAIAFVQSGMEHMVANTEGIASLGSLYYEPIWLFYRNTLKFSKLTELKGQRLIIGEPGSGTQMIARYLLAENGMLEASSSNPTAAAPAPLAGAASTLFEVGGADALAMLREGKADAGLFTVSPQSDLLQDLIHTPGIDFLDVVRADAYTARYPFLSSVTIAEGLLDLKDNIPDSPRKTLASTATLLVNEKFHPSFTPLVLEFFAKHLKEGGVLEPPHTFPSADKTGFTLTKEAEHYYQSGPPMLHRFLPFWAASLVDRLVIFVIPLLVVLIPLIKLAGPLYRWRIRSRIYKWYRFLMDIDRRIVDGEITDPEVEKQKIKDLESEINGVEVPLSHADELYFLKQHVEYIYRRLDALPAAADVKAASTN